MKSEKELKRKLQHVIELQAHADKDREYYWWFQLEGAKSILEWLLNKREEPYIPKNYM